MGRIVRRFGRFHQLEVTDQLYQYKVNDVAITEDVHGMRLRHAVDGVALTGFSYGIHIEQEVLDGGSISGTWEGARIEMYAPAGTTIATVYGIWIQNSIASAPTGQYHFMRFDENGGVTVHGAFSIFVGGAGDILNLFLLMGVHTAWSAVNDPPAAAEGRIAVQVSGVQKYIQLYN